MSFELCSGMCGASVVTIWLDMISPAGPEI